MMYEKIGEIWTAIGMAAEVQMIKIQGEVLMVQLMLMKFFTDILVKKS